jgi:L-cysteine S-thiosulfotransferase
MKCLLTVLLAVVLSALALTVAAQDTRRSGAHDMSAATRALQADDSQNPAMLWVKQGSAVFAQQCQRCHDAAALKRPAQRYPAFDAASKTPLTLSARINQCRAQRVGQPAWPPEADDALAVQTFLLHQARGEPIATVDDARAQPAVQQGERLWRQPMGQMALSCAQCHDGVAGRRLAGSVIPQGHATGYPVYRLEWQGMGSLQRRIRGCMTGVRAEPFAFGSNELTALELYMKQRAAGLPIETPAVRP